jgi:hypothetical protein
MSVKRHLRDKSCDPGALCAFSCSAQDNEIGYALLEKEIIHSSRRVEIVIFY